MILQIAGFFKKFKHGEIVWKFFNPATWQIMNFSTYWAFNIVFFTIDQIWHPCSGPKMVAPPVAPYQPTVTSNAKWQQFREGFQDGAGMSTSSNAFAQGEYGFCF